MKGDIVFFDEKTTFFRSLRPPSNALPKFTFELASNAEILRAQVLTCPSCVRQYGWSVVLSFNGFARLSPALRAELQRALGYPEAPLLDTEAAFKAAPATYPPGRGVTCPGGIRR